VFLLALALVFVAGQLPMGHLTGAADAAVGCGNYCGGSGAGGCASACGGAYVSTTTTIPFVEPYTPPTTAAPTPPPTPPPTPAPPPPTTPTTPTVAPTLPPLPPATTTPPAAPGAPTLTVDPNVGPAGSVTTATGTGFAPNSVVVLTWSTGIGTQLVPTDATGGFVTGVVIFDHDVTGPRNLIGTDQTSVAQAGLLVEAAPSQPARLVGRR